MSITLLFKNPFFLFHKVKKCIYLYHFLCIAFAKVASRVDDNRKRKKHVISTDSFSPKRLTYILRDKKKKKKKIRRKKYTYLAFNNVTAF